MIQYVVVAVAAISRAARVPDSMGCEGIPSQER